MYMYFPKLDIRGYNLVAESTGLTSEFDAVGSEIARNDGR